MRKTLLVLWLWLGLHLGAIGAESLTLVDGATLSGDIVKFDDNGLLLRVSGEVYTNIPWGRLSQASLKQLTANPKLKPLVEVFIEPDPSQRPPPKEIKINPVTRLTIPEHPSLLGGLVGSPVGLGILLVLYLANLFAAFEVAVFRARSPGQVMGISALLPIIGPVVFLAMPMKMDAPAAAEGEGDPAGANAKPEDEIKIVDASWKGEGTTFTMEVRTTKQLFPVTRIAQVTATEVIFETGQSGQVIVPFADIQEVTLTPKKPA